MSLTLSQSREDKGVSNLLDGTKSFSGILICGVGLSDELLGAICYQVSRSCPKVKYLILDSEAKVILDELHHKEEGLSPKIEGFSAFGSKSKSLALDLRDTNNAINASRFIEEFQFASQVEAINIVCPQIYRERDIYQTTKFNFPFMVYGADREDLHIQPIVDLLLVDYPNIKELKINNQFEDTLLHMQFVDGATILGERNSFIYSAAHGMLALNLHAFSESDTILKWLKEFPFKDMIVEIQLNHDDIRGRRLAKIQDFLLDFKELKRGDPDYDSPDKIKILAEYVLDTPDCYDLRDLAGLNRLKQYEATA